MDAPTEWDWSDFGAWCERDAFLLAKSRLQELTLRVQELEHALRNMAVMLPSDCPERDDSERIPPGFVYIRWIDLREARSVLNKETSRG